MTSRALSPTTSTKSGSHVPVTASHPRLLQTNPHRLRLVAIQPALLLRLHKLPTTAALVGTPLHPPALLARHHRRLALFFRWALKRRKRLCHTYDAPVSTLVLHGTCTAAHAALNT
ncbi:uncharacterized protein LAJ45_07759 [Morchella importuna]|uniref:uncharacterized protein n=1 Tax=Morchella importuna TaxID=1174673 RepID=UPI001E8CB25F|nr:uncharacterized protein LAJ45_07759 [Morchella importuna]KAH8148306.1 hypothetical protein LAJ45_07759 [Morchella importuna]